MITQSLPIVNLIHMVNFLFFLAAVVTILGFDDAQEAICITLIVWFVDDAAANVLWFYPRQDKYSPKLDGRSEFFFHWNKSDNNR